MKVRDKEPEDQPWIEKILSERWGGVKVIAHNEIFDAQSLPALIAGEKDGLATFRIQQRDQIKFAELMTLDAVKANQGVGTALIEALIKTLGFVLPREHCHRIDHLLRSSKEAAGLWPWRSSGPRNHAFCY